MASTSKFTAQDDSERLHIFDTMATHLERLKTANELTHKSKIQKEKLDWSPAAVLDLIDQHLIQSDRELEKLKNPNSAVRKVTLDLATYTWLLENPHVSDCIVFNIMRQEIERSNRERTEFREWDTEDDYDILMRVQAAHINANESHIRLAVNRMAKRNKYDPVMDWLTSLEWDQKSRLERLLPDYFNGEDTLYSRSVGPMFMISAVARQFEPGCQVDHMMILEGKQGLYKTRGLEALFGQGYVNDNLTTIKGRDASLQIKGFLAINIDEMGAFKGNKLANLKSFITKREETYVRKYENRNTKEPRRCIFMGTTNETQYLFDDDNRRYWPHEVKGKIDKDIIARDRDQIWAEAVHRYKAGEQWWPTDDMVPIFAAEQMKRQPHDPLMDQLHQFVWFFDKITINEICEKLYGRQSTADKGKASIIGRQLSKLGFTSSRHHGSLQYWHRPDPVPEQFQLIIAHMLDQERSRFVEKMYEFTEKFRYPPDRSEIDPVLYDIYHANKNAVRGQSELYDKAKTLIANHYAQFGETKENTRFKNKFLDEAYFHIIHNLFPVPILGQHWIDWDGTAPDPKGESYDLFGEMIELDLDDVAKICGKSSSDPLLVDDPKTIEHLHYAYNTRQQAAEMDRTARQEALNEQRLAELKTKKAAEDAPRLASRDDRSPIDTQKDKPVGVDYFASLKDD